MPGTPVMGHHRFGAMLARAHGDPQLVEDHPHIVGCVPSTVNDTIAHLSGVAP